MILIVPAAGGRVAKIGWLGGERWAGGWRFSTETGPIWHFKTAAGMNYNQMGGYSAHFSFTASEIGPVALK